MARTGARSKTWIRSAGTSVAAIAGQVTRADVISSVRQTSLVNLPITGTQLGLPNEFTVIRLLGWWQLEHFATTAAAGTTNNPPAIIGVRTAGAEEIEEMVADNAFATESGPVLDPMADWMAWVPCYTDSATGFDANASELFTGKGHFDIRSSRRVDGLRDDIVIMAQFQGTVPTGMRSDLRLSWAALCLT